MAGLPTVLLAACTALLALVVPLLAGDPYMLQDFCIADYKSLDGPLRLNGFPCKRPENVTADDFFSDVMSFPGNTGNPLGSAMMAANVEKVPGLNTMGLSMTRVDYAPWGILFVLEGSLDAGFITTTGKLFTRTVCKGGLFVIPRGFIHYEKNSGGSPAVAISAYNGQLPGTQSLAQAMVFAASPQPTDELVRAL